MSIQLSRWLFWKSYSIKLSSDVSIISEQALTGMGFSDFAKTPDDACKFGATGEAPSPRFTEIPKEPAYGGSRHSAPTNKIASNN